MWWTCLISKWKYSTYLETMVEGDVYITAPFGNSPRDGMATQDIYKEINHKSMIGCEDH